MLTPKVGHMAMSASTGSITVTDTPEELAKVGAYALSYSAHKTLFSAF
ncbi:hypothetical protein [Uliginosibacterium gangwonense]|nr:hypothetical protein [Uliginosibacterium gangwonense]